MRNDRSGVVTRAVNRVKHWSVRARDRVRSLPVRASHRGQGPPLPPARLMHLVAASEDVSWFLDGGKQASSSLRAILAKNGVALESLGSILDFGCGAGRVLRHWEKLQGPTLHGTDYNPTLITWCQKNLPFVQFQLNELGGGLAYKDESFDLIYALSVFTHLDEPLQYFWMRELSRILRPGGYLFITTHGEHYLPQLAAEEQERFRRGEIVVVGSRREGSNDCATFHPESYMRSTLAADLEVVDFVPEGALGNPRQDVFLLRKPRS
ncbi:class I SAM-dependent methyltransferase [Singulisphaera sp. Ch08]|uniref:Class I SAM-dependent methyltransferase n=1 Tax=Singulisphaera sp. Ch08 TaxID=3120278 RepID=A0AAU7CGN7_9BACT